MSGEIDVIVGAAAAEWELRLLQPLSRRELGVRVRRRCSEVGELLGVALRDRPDAVIVDGVRPWTDREVVDTLHRAGTRRSDRPVPEWVVTGGQRGQASAVLVGVLLIGLMVVGLAVDGARMFTARRDLQNVADSAALAGASAIDEDAYRSSGGADVRLEPAAVRAAVSDVLRASEVPASVGVDVQVTEDRVIVRLARAVRPLFLGLAGMHAQRIGAHATAAPRTS